MVSTIRDCIPLCLGCFSRFCFTLGTPHQRQCARQLRSDYALLPASASSILSLVTGVRLGVSLEFKSRDLHSHQSNSCHLDKSKCLSLQGFPFSLRTNRTKAWHCVIAIYQNFYEFNSQYQHIAFLGFMRYRIYQFQGLGIRDQALGIRHQGLGNARVPLFPVPSPQSPVTSLRRTSPV